MALQTYSFAQITSNIATAAQASATALLDFTVGSPLLAIAQAISGVVLWLQAIILQLLTLTRAATSSGADLDSFMADYGLKRLPAISATGAVTFSRFTPTMQAVIPVGATVATSDGTQTFSVTLNSALASYSSALGGYVIPPGTASLSIPVMAGTPGSSGNIQPGTLTSITTPLAGVDTATNASAFINGINAESDPALRARFVLYLASLSKATKAAVGYAITGIQQGLTYTITENADYNGTQDFGMFTVIVDDGSGYPPTSLLMNVSNAIEAVRPLTSRFGVFAPTVLPANVTMILATGANYVHNAVVAGVTLALQNFINSLPLGTSLPYTQLAAIAYSVPGVTNASGIVLNSTTSDLTANAQDKILAGAVAVS